jgi:hypothetical protein
MDPVPSDSRGIRRWSISLGLAIVCLVGSWIAAANGAFAAPRRVNAVVVATSSTTALPATTIPFTTATMAPSTTASTVVPPTEPVTAPPATSPPQTSPPPIASASTALPATPVVYPNCAAARAAGAAPIHVGQPGYARSLDRDGDGVACE